MRVLRFFSRRVKKIHKPQPQESQIEKLMGEFIDKQIAMGKSEEEIINYMFGPNAKATLDNELASDRKELDLEKIDIRIPKELERHFEKITDEEMPQNSVKTSQKFNTNNSRW